MDHELKQRLIGALVVTILSAIFIPMLFDDPIEDDGQAVTTLALPSENQFVEEPAIKAPASSDTMALIPIKHSGSNQTGDLYVEFGGSLQDNKRIYFGPVNIDRMRVKLYDDKGNILNMNGADWSITLIADILYQY